MVEMSDPGSTDKQYNPLGKLLIFAGVMFLVLFNAKIFLNMLPRILAGHTDAAAFYSAALLVREGKGDRLYDPEAQWKVQQELFPQVEIRKAPIFDLHLAYRSLLWVPLTYLPYWVAMIVWTALNLCILAFLSIKLPRYFPNLRNSFTFPFILLLLAFYPVFNALIHGQGSIILLLLYALAFINMKKGRPYLAGCFLALGLFKFQLVIPLVAILLLGKQRKVALGFGVAAVLPILSSFLIIGWQGSLDYFNLLLRANQGVTDAAQQHLYAVSPIDMPNLRGLFYTTFGRLIPEQYIVVLTVVCSIALVSWAVILWNKHSDDTSFDLCFASSVAVSMLVSYHMPLHDLTLLVLPMLILADHLFASRERANARWGISIAPVVLLIASPVYFLLFNKLGGRTLLALAVISLVPIISQQINRRRYAESLAAAARLSG
jgi:hypothetical protein